MNLELPDVEKHNFYNYIRVYQTLTNLNDFTDYENKFINLINSHSEYMMMLPYMEEYIDKQDYMNRSIIADESLLETQVIQPIITNESPLETQVIQPIITNESPLATQWNQLVKVAKIISSENTIPLASWNKFLNDLYSNDESEKELNILDFQVVDVSEQALYSGTDWIYTFFDTIIAYNYNYNYLLLFANYFDDVYNYFFKVVWLFSQEKTNLQLYFSIFLDQYIKSLIYNFPFINTWTKNLFFTLEYNYLLLVHSEFIFFNAMIVKSYVSSFSSNFNVTMTNLFVTESFLISTLTWIHLFIISIFFFFGLILYFSFFVNANKEENLLDQDFMYFNTTLEAEEEIASIDDLVMLLIILIGIYGWYFYMHLGFIFFKYSDFILLIFLFPFLYFIILCIPTLLLYDFGVYFITYLKGVASAPIFILELIFDYVAIMAFYIRILVQGVRLLLMTFTFASLQELILNLYGSQKTISGCEELTSELYNSLASIELNGYYFFLTILMKIFYWIYELLHTLFVLTAQCIAFFAMVFWLFFFLYTFFVSEKHEAYLEDKRSNSLNFSKKNLPFKFKFL